MDYTSWLSSVILCIVVCYFLHFHRSGECTEPCAMLCGILSFTNAPSLFGGGSCVERGQFARQEKSPGHSSTFIYLLFIDYHLYIVYLSYIQISMSTNLILQTQSFTKCSHIVYFKNIIKLCLLIYTLWQTDLCAICISPTISLFKLFWIHCF